MIYKSKKEKDRAIMQFVGDCVVNGMRKSKAIVAAQEEFGISQATVYLAIRRNKKRTSEEPKFNGSVYNG